MNMLKKYFPGTYKFFVDFFDGLNNKNKGLSLRKLLSVGFFWLTAAIVVEYTDVNNLVSVITVLCSMITALMITNTVGNYQERKLDTSNDKPKTDDATTDASQG